jgi:hypothetical protein
MHADRKVKLHVCKQQTSTICLQIALERSMWADRRILYSIVCLGQQTSIESGHCTAHNRLACLKEQTIKCKLEICRQAGTEKEVLNVYREKSTLHVGRDKGGTACLQAEGALHVCRQKGTLHACRQKGALYACREKGALHACREK